MAIESGRGGGYKEDDDNVVKVISKLDNRMRDGQGEEEGRHWWEEDKEEIVEKATIPVRLSSWKSMRVSHLGRWAAGRSRSDFPDKPCSLIPPVHIQGHTESEPHGSRCVTCPVSFH